MTRKLFNYFVKLKARIRVLRRFICRYPCFIGEALIHHSVLVDPNYTYGHASIALTEAENHHEPEALDHLEVVTHAEVIDKETAVIANMAWFVLAIQKHDLEAARKRLEMTAQIAPKYPLLERYQKMLKEAEEDDKTFGPVLEYRCESAKRAHQKHSKTPLTAEMALHACLEIHTKEMLVASAHFVQTSSSGKKGELVDWLSEVLLDTEFLQETLDEYLEERERRALR
jgi:hypothetical protein